MTRANLPLFILSNKSKEKTIHIKHGGRKAPPYLPFRGSKRILQHYPAGNPAGR